MAPLAMPVLSEAIIKELSNEIAARVIAETKAGFNVTRVQTEIDALLNSIMHSGSLTKLERAMLLIYGYDNFKEYAEFFLESIKGDKPA